MAITGFGDIQSKCRICLEKRSNMSPLKSYLIDAEEESTEQSSEAFPLSVSIAEALEKIMRQKLIVSKDYPSAVCTVCKNHLKTAYNFNELFHNSQETLRSVLKDNSFEEQRKSSNTTKKLAPVELIFGNDRFDLNDVVIVEEEKDESGQCFKAFLGNLGAEISAEFVNQKFKSVNNIKEETEEVDQTREGLKTEITTETVELIRPVKQDMNLPNSNVVSDHKYATCNKRRFQLRVCNKTKRDDKGQTRESSCKNRSAKKHNDKTPTSYLCDICGHVSENKGRARYHRQTHRERRFECDICHKKFHFKINYTVHRNSHSNVRDHLCTLCGKTFYYANALVYHMRMHTNERNYVCEYCNRRFYMQSTLKRHVRTHTDDRPYVCTFCQKGFRSSGECKKHEQIHTGERPHVCQFCEKTFSSRYNRLVHYMSHGGPHECDFCHRTFIEAEFLKRHIKDKHKTVQYCNTSDN